MVDMTAMDDNHFRREEREEREFEERRDALIKHAEELLEAADVKTNVLNTYFTLSDIAEAECDSYDEIIAALCNGTGETLMKKYIANWAHGEAA